MVYTYFTDIYKSRGVPLTYVIRKTPTTSGFIIDNEQEITQNTPLRGNIFSRSTKKVLVIIKELTVYYGAETWMKDKHCDEKINVCIAESL